MDRPESEPRTMDKIKAFNPGPSEKVADQKGRIIDAHDWAEVDPTDSVTQRLLQNGGLIVPEEPASSTEETTEESTEPPVDPEHPEPPVDPGPPADPGNPDKAEPAPAGPEKKRGSQKTAAKNGDS